MTGPYRATGPNPDAVPEEKPVDPGAEPVREPEEGDPDDDEYEQPAPPPEEDENQDQRG